MEKSDLVLRLSQLTTWSKILEEARSGAPERRKRAQVKLVDRYSPVIRPYLKGAVRREFQRRGVSGDRSEAVDELYQTFFTRFLEGKYINQPERGRFRDFLKTCLHHLVKDFFDRKFRKRVPQWAEGGPERVDPQPPVPVLAGELPEKYRDWLGDDLVSEAEYKKIWREEILDRAWQALEREERQQNHFLYTVQRFSSDHPDLTSAQIAEHLRPELGERLGKRPDNWVRKKQAAARQRFAAFLIEEVAGLVDPASLDNVLEELRDLDLFRYCRKYLDKEKNPGPFRRKTPGARRGDRADF